MQLNSTLPCQKNLKNSPQNQFPHTKKFYWRLSWSSASACRSCMVHTVCCGFVGGLSLICTTAACKAKTVWKAIGLLTAWSHFSSWWKLMSRRKAFAWSRQKNWLNRGKEVNCWVIIFHTNKGVVGLNQFLPAKRLLFQCLNSALLKAKSTQVYSIQIKAPNRVSPLWWQNFSHRISPSISKAAQYENRSCFVRARAANRKKKQRKNSDNGKPTEQDWEEHKVQMANYQTSWQINLAVELHLYEHSANWTKPLQQRAVKNKNAPGNNMHVYYFLFCLLLVSSCAVAPRSGCDVAVKRNIDNSRKVAVNRDVLNAFHGVEWLHGREASDLVALPLYLSRKKHAMFQNSGG